MVPYNRITDVRFTKSIWQRVFGGGTVTLNTAGSNELELTISYVKDPEAVYDVIASKSGE